MSSAATLDVYIGYDNAERVAYHVLSQSLVDHASRPLRITPIARPTLAGVHDRPRISQQSTEFSFTRFLTPFLSGYAGWSLYMDCDMLVRADIAELFALADDRFAVMVAQHDYTPRDSEKFLGHVQLPYPKKNWSSVMLFNNARCRALTPDYVNSATGLDLHQFRWLDGDAAIGDLPLTWNWLVGEYAADPAAHIVHFTRGGPYFAAYADCDYADEWRAARARAFGTADDDAGA